MEIRMISDIPKASSAPERIEKDLGNGVHGVNTYYGYTTKLASRFRATR